MKDTPGAYNRLADRYNRRWDSYLEESLGRALRLIEARGPFSLLDVGCGTGLFLERLLLKFPEASFNGIDPSPGMLGKAQEKLSGQPRVRLKLAFAEALPFEGAVFDWVVCVNDLHAFRSPKKAAHEMFRVLKPGGRILLLDWCRDSWMGKIVNCFFAWLDPAHVWMYTTAEMKNFLAAQGFEIARLERFRLRLWEMAALVGVKA
ncbi:MAG: methyltransferase domain-containing protein [Candidatus Omnitrophica bacterium]|nr:methyltransferase domain-containing protein [Candidatus Omnitrophota bacterium]